ncbi:MAG: AzlC family ABC transporter permease [Gemmatimonadaceae bacterium]
MAASIPHSALPTLEARNRYVDGARAVLPLAAVIGVLGVVLGYSARVAGFSTLATAVMSATTFAGGAQFAAIAVLQSGGTVAAAVATAVALNARYALMAATLAPSAGDRLLDRLLVSHLTVDESWAVAYADDGRFSRERLIGAGLVLLVVHVTTTALGAAAGPSLGDPRALGLDAALPALFLLLVWPRLRDRDDAFAAFSGAAMALALTPIAPAGIPVLGAAAAAFVRAPGRSKDNTLS